MKLAECFAIRKLQLVAIQQSTVREFYLNVERGLNRNFWLNFDNMKHSFHRTLNQNLKTNKDFLNFRKSEAWYQPQKENFVKISVVLKFGLSHCLILVETGISRQYFLILHLGNNIQWDKSYYLTSEAHSTRNPLQAFFAPFDCTFDFRQTSYNLDFISTAQCYCNLLLWTIWKWFFYIFYNQFKSLKQNLHGKSESNIIICFSLKGDKK